MADSSSPMDKGSINRTPTGYKGGDENLARRYSPYLLRRYVYFMYFELIFIMLKRIYEKYSSFNKTCLG
jgi:hypothetical protein